ncbi:hypothetical protein [Streptomyces sp. GZWMJZ-114]|uniref:hypothetical protein n=1 Tax=Streptomyces sp. GZWMJZ-114 TaxID=2494734 RepID=UPI0010106EDF|nr:hypothetical protein [Streptomyces sp. GZWMJZ-114]
MGHHATLHGPHRQGLYVLDRPLKKEQRIVIPIAPPLDHSRIVEQYQIDDDPAAIVVPTDPARAAALVSRRLLPRYELALTFPREPVPPRPPSHPSSSPGMHRQAR